MILDPRGVKAAAPGRSVPHGWRLLGGCNGDVTIAMNAVVTVNVNYRSLHANMLTQIL